MNVFPELRIEDLRAELEPDKLGRRAGERGLPSTEAAEDASQVEIEEFLEARKNEAVRRRDEQLAQVDEHLGELDEAVLAGDMEGAASKAATEFREVEQRELQEFKVLLHEFNRKRTDFFDFKHSNSLDREPDVLSPRARAVAWGLLVVLLLIESSLNAVFLAAGSEAGLVGGWGLAIGFSFVNLFLPVFIFGRFSRLVNHVAIPRKLIGVAVILLWVAFAVVLNLGLAHFRDASEALVEDAGAAAFERFREAPIGLAGFESWLLFVVGFSFSGFAFLDGVKLRGDAYPGYYKKYQKMEAARTEYEEAKARVLDDLRDIREECLGVIERTAHKAKRQPVERRRVLEHEDQVLRDFAAWVEQLERFGTMVVDEYREANQAVRFDREQPRAHLQKWELSSPSPHRVRRGGDVVEETDLESLNEQYEAAARRVHDEWERTQSQFKLERQDSRRVPASGADRTGDGRA